MVCPDCQRLAEIVERLSKEIEILKKDNAELKARLAIYENAHTPSSQKHFAKQTQPATEPEHPPKPPGRSNGHEGTGRKTPSEIHELKTLEPLDACPDCGAPTTRKRTRKRTLSSLVRGWLKNTEYSFHQWYCKRCHKTFEPRVPNALPNSRFDLTLAFWIACLRMLGISVDKIRFLLKTDYDLHVSSATVVNTCNKLASFLGEDYEQLRKELLKEKRLHADETGWPVKGVNWWLWEFISRRTAFYAIRHSRKHDVPEQILKGFKGVLSADFWNAYNCLSCEKQRCWAHLKRELDHVLKKKPSVEFAEFASQLLMLYYWATSQRNHGKNTRLEAEKQLRVLTSQKYVDLDVLRLVKRLRRHEKELFTFCARRGVEKDNNRAERGIRPAVVIRKVCYGSQSEKGAETTAVLMSFYQTSRLREENFLDFMQNLAGNRLQN